MRRICSTLAAGAAVFAFAAADAEAQTIGAKLGASFSTLSSDMENEDIGSATGFAGGGFVRVGLGRFGLQVELLSVSKGASFDGTGEDAEISLEYVEIPVLLHVPLSLGTGFAPYVFGGPAVAFEVGCDFEAGDISVDCDAEGAEFFERPSTDIGLAAGGGLAFGMGPGAVLLEGRYTWGMTNLNDGPDEEEVKNRAGYVMLGYEIPLSGF
ncbi:MAG: porin family protein [Gemmatimonadota bacterium]